MIVGKMACFLLGIVVFVNIGLRRLFLVFLFLFFRLLSIGSGALLVFCTNMMFVLIFLENFLLI